MKNIDIKVQEKIATLLDNSKYIVCGNSDYFAVFHFDEEWEGYNNKTAIFVDSNDRVKEVSFAGNKCKIPELSRTNMVAIGVVAGDIRTTTPCYVKCVQSVSDLVGEQTMPENLYLRLVTLLNEKMDEISLSIEEQFENMPTATPDQSGLMSNEDKKAIETFKSLIEDDRDYLVNTIYDVLQVFENFQEGRNVLDLFNSKRNVGTWTSSVYIRDSKGNEKELHYSSSKTGGTIVSRSTDGRSKFSDPIDDADAATKGWVIRQIEQLRQEIPKFSLAEEAEF